MLCLQKEGEDRRSVGHHSCLESNELCWEEWRGEREVEEGRERRHDGPHDPLGEAVEEGSTKEGSVIGSSGDYDYDNFIAEGVASRDPPGLWDEMGVEFPDPHTNLSAFLSYCGWSEKELTASLYILPHWQTLNGFTPPLATHGPTIYCMNNTVNTIGTLIDSIQRF